MVARRAVLVALFSTLACGRKPSPSTRPQAVESAEPAPQPTPAEAWRKIVAIELSGTAHHWEPQQLTHHHNDHCGGAREFVAAGADVIVGANNQQHFARMFKATHELDRESDTLRRAGKTAHVTEVAETLTLQSRTRAIQLLRIPNRHAEGMLIAYLPKERLAFVADLWSPGRDELRAPATFERHQDLVEALRTAKITPKQVIGGHGSVGNYAELATAVGAGPLD